MEEWHPPHHSKGRTTRNPMLFDALPGAELNRAPLPAIQNLVLLLHEPLRSTFVSFSSMRAEPSVGAPSYDSDFE